MYVDDMFNLDSYDESAWHGPMLQASNMVPYRLGQAEGIHGPRRFHGSRLKGLIGHSGARAGGRSVYLCSALEASRDGRMGDSTGNMGKW